MLALGTEGMLALIAIAIAAGMFIVAARNQRRHPSPFNVMLMWLTAGIGILAPTLLDLGPPRPLIFMAIGASALCSVMAVWALLKYFRGGSRNREI